MADPSPTLVVHPYNWSYAEKPDIPESVYRFATAYMIIIGTFGAIGNSAILLAFFTAPAKVSSTFFLAFLGSYSSTLVFLCLFLGTSQSKFGHFWPFYLSATLPRPT
jgi:hypothetical protein